MRPTRLSAVLSDADTKAFLVSNLTNIFYLTGVQLTYGFLLIKARKSVLYVDGRYTEKAKAAVRKGIGVSDIADFPKAMMTLDNCGFESDTVTVDQLRRWKRKFRTMKFVPKIGVIEEYRRSKDAKEIASFKKAQRITSEILQKVPRSLRSGVTEIDIAWKLEQWARSLGAEGLSFEPIVAFGTNTSRPHHTPTSRKFAKGHIVQIDVGAQVDGYAADQSAVFFTGAKTPLQKKVFLAVQRAKKESESAVKPGITNQKLDRIARNILAEENLEQYFVHSLGHGVGLDIHEGVSLSVKAKSTPLLKNEIITIEPGVYIPGKFGIRLESEIIV